MRTLIPYYCFELLYDCFIAALSIKHPDLMVTVFKERILKTVIFGGSTVTWFLPCMLLVKVIFELLRKTKNWQIPITIGLYLAGLLLPANGIQNKVLKLIELFGKNSIVILCTHMFFVELIRMIDAKACGSFLPKLGYAEGIIFATLILLCELIVIKLCNKYFWFAFGRSKPKKVLANE